MNRRLTGSSLFTLAIACAANASAQTARAPTPTPPRPAAASGSGETIQEVVVTAQRRTESLQKTALAISVVAPTALANAGITSPLQLTSVLPTLQIGSNGPASSVYLRGVGSYSSTAAQSPAVPYYIDGVYVARTQSVPSEFYDVERLELLKGPQGTLYGRNASGGAINILSKMPALGQFGGDANLELGSYSNQNGDFAINIPLGDTVAIRASGQIVDKGGYTSIGLGDDVHQSGRIKLLWKPNANVSLLLNASYGHLGGLGSTFVALNRQIPGWYPWLDTGDPRTAAYQLGHTVFGPAAPPGFIHPTSLSDAKQNLTFYNVSAELDWVLTPGLTLTIIPAYRDSRIQYSNLVSFLYDDGYGLGDQPAKPETSKATSVEARLSGDGRILKWVAGVYYYNEDQFQQYTVNGGDVQNGGVLANFGTRSYAAFGQATLAVTNTFRLIGGLRDTSDQRSISNGVSYVISPEVFLGPPPPAGAACAFPFPTQTECAVDSYAGEKTYHDISWKGGFEADVLQDSLLYATVARGFKAGGFNTQSIFGSPGKVLPFAPETLISYDVGLKNRFFGNRLQLNVAGFYWDYDGHQEPKIGLTNAGITNLIYYNAGASEIYGGDVEAVARPWKGATVNGSIEYVQSEYKNFSYDVPTVTYTPASSGCHGSPSTTPGATTLDCSGKQTVATPKWAGALGFTQEYGFEQGRLIFNANMTFASARWLAIDFTPIERAKSYTTLDLALTYRPPGAQWGVTLFGRNLTDGLVYTSAVQNPLSSLATASIGPPRTYGARVSYQF